MTLDFINPDSHVEPDNSPKMRFNNLILELQNLPKGDSVEMDEKGRIHAELVRIANTEFSGEDKETALDLAHKVLEQSLMGPEDLDKQYSI